MPDPKKMTFPELINYRYADRGGYKVLSEILGGELSYEQKIQEVQTRFRVSRSQIVKYWYPRYKLAAK